MILRGEILNKKLIFLIVFFLFPIVISLSEGEVSYEIQRGFITVKVQSESLYNNLIEFNTSVVNEIKTVTFDCGEGSCKGENAKRISFESVDIYTPGSYYFVISGEGQAGLKVKKEFNVKLEDLYSCVKNNIYIKNNKCYFDFTKDINDKGKKCENGLEKNRCNECGCPSSSYICCVNEKITECKGNLGSCVLPSQGRILEKEIKEKEIVIGKEVVSGCNVNNYNVPNGICANNVLDLGLKSSDDKFAMECYCSDVVSDIDNDGFDSVDFINGRDCRDDDPGINPIIIESCGPDINNNNNIDENCDGKDLDCSFSCDRDEDGQRDSKRWYCIGGKDCDDGNGNRFLGNQEICGDLVDNDCDDIKDNPNVCICKNGETRIVKGIIMDGEETCVAGKKWELTKQAINTPLFSLKTLKGLYENSPVSADLNEEVEVKVKYYCPGGGCKVEVS